MVQGPILIVILVAAIVLIVLLTAKAKLHPFVTLLLVAYGVGIASGLPTKDIISAITGGFGSTLGSIGIVIACGTIIGFLLEKSGAALVMANTILRIVGEARSALAMGITGAVVSIPVFCDSGFVILSPLNRSLAERSEKSLAVFAVALSMGLYSTHVFVPPTPGPIAAAGNLSADLGTVILLGLLVSIPTVIAGYIYANYMGSKIHIEPKPEATFDEITKTFGRLPSVGRSFAPLLTPVVLIALKSVADYPSKPLGAGSFAALLSFLGHPVTALLIGVFLAFFTFPKVTEDVRGSWVNEGIKNAGIIILITGAGGALGSVLRATPIASYLGESLSALKMGVFVPFIVAAALKTAQGSSTVSLITTSALMAPLLPALGLASPMGTALTVLAIGAGSMTASHANDSYFWVVAQLSDMDVTQAYKLQTVGSLVTGIVGIIVVFLLSLFLA